MKCKQVFIMHEMHLRQPGFTDSACEPFTKNKEKIQKFKETGDLWYSYQKEIDKACFQHDMAYGDFKDLTRRIVSDKILPVKAANTAKNRKYNGYQRGVALIVYRFFDNNHSGGSIKNENMSNRELAEELHEAIIGKF